MTISLQLQVHTIRRRGPLDYELLAYFTADQPLPQPTDNTPPWAYTDLEAALINYAALPVNHDSLAGLLIAHPRVRIQGRRALLRQRMGQGSHFSRVTMK
jgi:hypothetical protein